MTKFEMLLNRRVSRFQHCITAKKEHAQDDYNYLNGMLYGLILAGEMNMTEELENQIIATEILVTRLAEHHGFSALDDANAILNRMGD